MSHKVALIRGDGTGPELVAAVEKIIKAAKIDIEWIDVEAGLKCVEEGKAIVPQETIDKIKEIGVGLKGPMTTPIGKGSVSPNVTLRKKLDLFACVRPVHSLPGVVTPFTNLDIVLFRENTEDLYIQDEYMATATTAHTVKLMSVPAAERIIRHAFDYARKHGRKKVVMVHKANIMKIGDGLYLRTFNRIREEYPEIESWDNIVDNQCMQLVIRWNAYDVLILPNLYGDIVSDLAAGMMGGLGVAPGANFGDDCAVFEAVHGSAPKYTGMNKVNPTALLLSATLMLDHLGEFDARKQIEGALEATLRAGIKTYDLGGTAGTSDFADAVASQLKG